MTKYESIFKINFSSVFFMSMYLPCYKKEQPIALFDHNKMEMFFSRNSLTQLAEVGFKRGLKKNSLIKLKRDYKQSLKKLRPMLKLQYCGFSNKKLISALEEFQKSIKQAFVFYKQTEYFNFTKIERKLIKLIPDQAQLQNILTGRASIKHLPLQVQRLTRYLITIQKLKFQIRKPLNQLCLSRGSVLDRLVVAIIKQTKRRDIIALTADEVKNLLSGKKVNNQDQRQISSCLKTQARSNKIIIKTGLEVKKLTKQLAPKLAIKQLTGTIACQGLVRGRVKIIPLSDNPNYYLKQFKKNEILVSETTGPELMPAIKKAAAIITDEGGLMSHAALVSREFKTPCIVGTKSATKIFKNGDLVEIDANKGVVKILKSK